jgi:uncharacterized membrane protein YccC
VAPPVLFGLRLWASVCLALYMTFWPQLDNRFWAGTSAALGGFVSRSTAPARNRSTTARIVSQTFNSGGSSFTR